MSQSLNEMNETCIWQYIFLGEVGVVEGEGVKKMLAYYEGWLFNDDAWLQRGGGGGGVKNLGKSD